MRIKRAQILSSKIRQYFRPEKVHNFFFIIIHLNFVLANFILFQEIYYYKVGIIIFPFEYLHVVGSY